MSTKPKVSPEWSPCTVPQGSLRVWKIRTDSCALYKHVLSSIVSKPCFQGSQIIHQVCLEPGTVQGDTSRLVKTSHWLQNKSSTLAWPGQGRSGQNGTFVLMSTGGFGQHDVSPCRVSHGPCLIIIRTGLLERAVLCVPSPSRRESGCVKFRLFFTKGPLDISPSSVRENRKLMLTQPIAQVLGKSEHNYS